MKAYFDKISFFVTQNDMHFISNNMHLTPKGLKNFPLHVSQINYLNLCFVLYINSIFDVISLFNIIISTCLAREIQTST